MSIPRQFEDQYVATQCKLNHGDLFLERLISAMYSKSRPRNLSASLSSIRRNIAMFSSTTSTSLVYVTSISVVPWAMWVSFFVKISTSSMAVLEVEGDKQSGEKHGQGRNKSAEKRGD